MQFLLLTSPLGKENSRSTHVPDLHPTSNMTHYEITRNDQLTKHVKFSVVQAFASLINIDAHVLKITIYSSQHQQKTCPSSDKTWTQMDSLLIK